MREALYQRRMGGSEQRRNLSLLQPLRARAVGDDLAGRLLEECQMSACVAGVGMVRRNGSQADFASHLRLGGSSTGSGHVGLLNEDQQRASRSATPSSLIACLGGRRASITFRKLRRATVHYVMSGKSGNAIGTDAFACDYQHAFQGRHKPTMREPCFAIGGQPCSLRCPYGLPVAAVRSNPCQVQSWTCNQTQTAISDGTYAVSVALRRQRSHVRIVSGALVSTLLYRPMNAVNME
jgi:hypothetical protein